MKITIYGDFAVKFRAFGIDFGYIKRTIPFSSDITIDIPFPLTRPVRVRFDKYGVRADFWIAQVV